MDNLDIVQRNNLLFADEIAYNDFLRIQDQEKMYYYYTGDKSKLHEYLEKALKKTWSDDRVKRMLFTYILLTRKIVRGLSTVYNEPATRELTLNGKTDSKATEYFNSILPDKTAKLDKQAHRLTKLLNTTLPMITFSAKKGKFEQILNPSHLYTVVQSENPRVADKIAYDKFFKINDENKLITVVWDDERHFGLDANNSEIVLPYMDDPEAESEDEKKLNPFGVKPFITFRMDETSSDFWGEGLTSLVEENEVINEIATKFNLEDLIYGTTGILHGVNLGDLINKSPKKSSNDQQDEETEKTVMFGRDALVLTDTNPSQTISPSINWIGTNPQILEIIEALEWKMKTCAVNHGLNPNAFSMRTFPESGLSKLIDSASEITERVDDVEACRDYEKQRFELIRIMNNKIIEGKYEGYEKLQPIDENLNLTIDFKEPKLQMSISDKWTDREKEVAMNMKTPADFLLEDNPDIKTLKEAEAQIEANKLKNDTNKADKNMIINKDIIF